MIVSSTLVPVFAPAFQVAVAELTRIDHPFLLRARGQSGVNRTGSME